jgi:hypothetical protein
MLCDEEAYIPPPSSDGNFIVYQRNSEGKKRVPAERMSTALSLDERQIAYTDKTNGNWKVFNVDRGSGDVRKVTRDPRDEMAPRSTPLALWSSHPTGKEIFNYSY